MSAELEDFLGKLGPGVDVASVFVQLGALGVQFPEELGEFATLLSPFLRVEVLSTHSNSRTLTILLAVCSPSTAAG